MALVIDNKQSLSPDKFDELFEKAKAGQIQVEKLAEYGIELPQDISEYIEKYDCQHYESKLIAEDFKTEEKWDNQEIIALMKEAYLSQKQKSEKSVLRKAKRWIQKQSGTKMLEAPEESSTVNSKTEVKENPTIAEPKPEDNPWKLDPSQLNTAHSEGVQTTEHTGKDGREEQ